MPILSYDEHKNNVEITGEAPEYFAEYKIVDMARHLFETRAACSRITDFGSGIGYSIPYLRRYFPDAAIILAWRAVVERINTP